MEIGDYRRSKNFINQSLVILTDNQDVTLKHIKKTI